MESSIFYLLDERPPGDLSPWSLRSRGLRSPGKATATTCCSSLLLDASYLLLSRYFHRVLLPLSPLLLLPPCNSILPEILYTNISEPWRYIYLRDAAIEVMQDQHIF